MRVTHREALESASSLESPVSAESSQFLLPSTALPLYWDQGFLEQQGHAQAMFSPSISQQRHQEFTKPEFPANWERWALT